MTTITMKMSNGDEIIAKRETETHDSYIVGKPRVIFHDGRQGGLAPYIISDPERTSIEIDKSFVVAVFDTGIEMSNAYLKATTSIQLAG